MTGGAAAAAAGEVQRPVRDRAHRGRHRGRTGGRPRQAAGRAPRGLRVRLARAAPGAGPVRSPGTALAAGPAHRERPRRVGASASRAAAERRRVVGGTTRPSTPSCDQLGQPAQVGGDHRHAAPQRLQHRHRLVLVPARRHDGGHRRRGPAAAARAWPAGRGSGPGPAPAARPAPPASARTGPSPAMSSRDPGRHGGDRLDQDVDALLAGQPAGEDQAAARRLLGRRSRSTSTKWLITRSRSGKTPARVMTSARNRLGLTKTSTGS